MRDSNIKPGGGTVANASIDTTYYQVDKNHELVRRLFNTYYRAHHHSGKLFDDLPEFFLVAPEVLADQDLATRSSDKLIIEDCVQRAIARNGYIGVIKHRNPKLKYYWLELVVTPFMLGDQVTEDNEGAFYYLLSNFVEYAKQHPKLYGDLTAELDSDKDLALMLKEINRLGEKLLPLLEFYSQDQLVSFNPQWPVEEVKKLLVALKDNEQSWCEVFFEYLMYVMGHKART
jgi:hypothetical protein